MSSLLKRITSPLITVCLLIATMLASPKPAFAGLFVNSAALEQSSQFALDPMFSAVGWMGGSSGGSNFFAGTGFLIDPYWVLTAGHVANPMDGTIWDSMFFGLGNNVFEDHNRMAVDTWFVHPDWSINDSPGKGFDAALIRLIDPIFDVAPLPIYTEQMDVGQHFHVAGYGSPGLWPDAGEFDGIKRAGENLVDCFGCLTAVDDQYALTFFEQNSPLTLEWQGSGGDSGSPWIIDVNGQPFAGGITGFTRGNFRTGALRTDSVADWVFDTMAQNAPPDLPPAVVPEPSSFVLFTLAFLLLGCSQKVWRKQTDTT